MAPRRLVKTEGIVRHVARLAAAARKLDVVVAMRSLRRNHTQLGVASQASGIGAHSDGELIIGPHLCRTGIFRVLVHAVTGQAGQLSALEAGALDFY